MEGDCVEVQVEGMTAGQTEPAHGVEPAAHQLWIADRVFPALYSVKNDPVGDDVQTGEEASPWFRNPLMASRWRAVSISFMAKSDRRGQPGGIIFYPWNPEFWRMRSRLSRNIGTKRNKPPLSTKKRVRKQLPGRQPQSAVVGREPGGRSSSARRGKRANPSSLRTRATATWLRGCPWWARLRLMS